MKNIDIHTHTKEFSNDANMGLEELLSVQKSNSNNIFCTTEHFDYDYDLHPSTNQLIVDIQSYSISYHNRKNEFENSTDLKYPILFGIEFGFLNHLGPFYDYLSKLRAFDMIIGSIHCVNGLDPYYDEEIFNNGNYEAYSNYLKEIINMLDKSNGFDVVGHYDYISRYSPYKDKLMKYEDFTDLFDSLLIKCIQKGKALELNTKTSAKLRPNIPNALFDTNILKRYKELGGELITLGSDAHEVSSLFTLFEETINMLKENNFKYITYYENRNPIFVKI